LSLPILDHFGLIAPYYDRVIRLQTAEKIIKVANLPIQGIILDAGGGTGRVAEALRGQARSVVLADLSYQMLKQAQKKGGLQIACSHTEYLPFPDETFERVIMVDALHHVCDQSKTAEELWRVLIPGGQLVIEEPDIRTFSVKLIALAEKLALMRSHFLSPQAIVRLFPDKNARTRIERDGFNAWIVINKVKSES
jgi:demethylmenaquinone methyltransferase/2-methoxy-6-polyprenyl-1,4-benzoquinol methylase